MAKVTTRPPGTTPGPWLPAGRGILMLSGLKPQGASGKPSPGPAPESSETVISPPKPKSK